MPQLQVTAALNYRPAVNMVRSPTFPSRGGPDCASACAPGHRSVGTAFFNVFPDAYTEKISQAGAMVRQIAPNATTYTEGVNGFMDSHSRCQLPGTRSHVLLCSFVLLLLLPDCGRARYHQGVRTTCTPHSAWHKPALLTLLGINLYSSLCLAGST